MKRKSRALTVLQENQVSAVVVEAAVVEHNTAVVLPPAADLAGNFPVPDKDMHTLDRSYFGQRIKIDKIDKIIAFFLNRKTYKFGSRVGNN